MSETSNRSVSRALFILEKLASSREPLALRDIAEELEIPKSSSLVLLRALEEHEFVERDAIGRYSVGLRAFEIGMSYIRGMSSVRAASDQLRILTEALNVTAHFAVLDGDDVVYVAKEDPEDLGVRLASFIGARLPAATTAVGTAQLACLPPRPALLAADSTLEERLALARSRGYAVDNGAIISGVKCVAAPVMDEQGCCGAIGVSYLEQTSLDEAAISARVIEAAATASIRLGGRGFKAGVA